MQSVSAIVKVMRERKWISSKPEDEAEWISVAEFLAREYKGQPHLLIASMEIAGLLMGKPEPSRQEYARLAAMPEGKYKMALKPLWKKAVDAAAGEDGRGRLPKLSCEAVGRVLGLESLVPWIERLVSSYEGKMNLSRDEQPACIVAAFTLLVSPLAAQTYPFEAVQMKAIRDEMKPLAAQIKGDPDFRKALQQKLKNKSKNRKPVAEGADNFSLEIEPVTSRSASPVEPTSRFKDPRAYILPMLPFYETEKFARVQQRMK